MHLLKGLIKCGQCGTSLTPYPSRKKDPGGQPYLYYTCTHVTQDGTDSECPVRSIPARPFEDLIIGYLGEIGRHPEIIEATVKAATDAKTTAIRPMKSELAEIERRIKKLFPEIANLTEAARKMGSKAITDEFMANAYRLTAERQELELKKTKLTTEVNFGENAVADKEVIAKAVALRGGRQDP